MSGPTKKGNQAKPVKNNRKGIIAAIGGLLLIAVVVTIIRLAGGSGESGPAASGGDIAINKSDISETVKFYPYKAGKTNMEVLAVKASDGTIRTAFNTCQVCYDSGKGYYKQEGDTLVCQNCGNVFSMDQVEKIKGGCNPVPITEDNKSDDGTTITITADFLQQNKDLFGNWKKQ